MGPISFSPSAGQSRFGRDRVLPSWCGRPRNNATLFRCPLREAAATALGMPRPIIFLHVSYRRRGRSG